MKRCPLCKKELPNELFRKDKSHIDGLDGWCKFCRRERRNPEKEKERKRKYFASLKEKPYKKYRFNNPEKVKAQLIAQYRFKEAKLCSVEGCGIVGERHHYDYRKPLEIIWLCKKHHRAIHRTF